MKRIALITALGLCLLPALLHAETPLLEVTAAVDTTKAPWLQSCRQTAVAVHRQAPPSQTCEDCYNQPRPNTFCREVCGCYSAFCGSW